MTMVLVRCKCDRGKIAFGRYCPDCGGMGTIYVPEISVKAYGYKMVEP